MPTTMSSPTRPASAGWRGEQRVGHAQPVRAEHEAGRARRRSTSAAQKVHGRRAHEARDEHVGRVVVELLRRGGLLEPAVAHDRDAVAHRHRLGLVVRDVERRRAELLVQAREVRAHLDAQLGVEVRQRLVHQERLRLAHDRAPERDALALAAGERARAAREQVADAQARRGAASTLLADRSP